MKVIAHELGHSLGLFHDGILSSAACPSSDGYIMASPLAISSNPNTLKFSPCSIAALKRTLLTFDLRFKIHKIKKGNKSVESYFCVYVFSAVETEYACLTNVPSDLPIETTYVTGVKPGQLWSADDQCKMNFGSQATFCWV